MKNFIKNQKGFTLVELVVVIAIIGILAGMAIPRFLDATASARGAKVVADMRTIQSAEMIYFAKYSKYPTTALATGTTDFTNLVQGGWPLPPAGKIIVAPTMSNNTNAKPYEGTIASGATYKYTGTGVEPGNLTVTVGSNDVTLTQLLQGTTTTPTP